MNLPHSISLPRLVVAAPASGHGKTTIATGLMAALARRGLTVSGHKVGPDYIDPGYHSLATGRPGRNLDPHLVGEDLLVPLLLHGAAGADLAVVEGVMGLYDGQIGGQGFSSTAHVAAATRTPVVLVVDISHASRSVGAIVHGMATYDESVEIVGVILNKAGSARHADEARASVRLPVLGVLHRDDGIVAPSRHLGLVPAAERDEAAASLERLTERIEERIDIDAVIELAGRAPALDAEPWDPAAALQSVVSTDRSSVAARPPTDGSSRPHPPVVEQHLPVVEQGEERARSVETTPAPVVAMAGGRAFTFRYAETEELLRAAGCAVVTFDPLTDRSLPPDTAGLYLGGGFPEVHAAGLSANESLRRDLAEAIAAGMPTVAECAGLLYLCRSVDDAAMIGALPAQARMSPRLTLSYRRATSMSTTLLGRPGESVTGHEFHRTTVEPAAGSTSAWQVDDTQVGFASESLHASYLHTHWAGHPQLAARFADAVHAFAAGVVSGAAAGVVSTDRPRPSACSTTSTAPASVGEPVIEQRAPASVPEPVIEQRAPASVRRDHPTTETSDPLRHHGDVEASDDMIDFAVNVYDGPRPSWLHDALVASLDTIDHYPSSVEAERQLARKHGRGADEVLATAGAAEAFTLIARMRDWNHPIVVHPQFTEPDVALTMAGHKPDHVLCKESEGFALVPDRVPDEADLVIIGNPTNPTGVLHPSATIRALLRPGRVVVVDEAFIDAVPGETGSLAGQAAPGLVVVRSLTKLWAIPGVRAGYLLGSPDLIDELRAHQTPWSLSTTAAAAITATCSSEASAEAAHRARQIAVRRTVLTDGLDELGLTHTASSAPFVLVRTPADLRERLRAAGFALRRADTFPGLDEGWVRIAVRAPATTRKLLATLRVELAAAL